MPESFRRYEHPELFSSDLETFKEMQRTTQHIEQQICLANQVEYINSFDWEKQLEHNLLQEQRALTSYNL